MREFTCTWPAAVLARTFHLFVVLPQLLRPGAQGKLNHMHKQLKLAADMWLNVMQDPHFKVANHRRRIINDMLLADYAYCLAPGGQLYTITDVAELGQWMARKLDAHPLFERLSDDELASDPAAGVLTSATEEGQKVARNSGQVRCYAHDTCMANVHCLDKGSCLSCCRQCPLRAVWHTRACLDAC